MNHRSFNAVMCSFLLVATVGCQDTHPPVEPAYVAGSISTQSWSPNVDAPVPGIDQAYLWSYWIPQTPANQHLVLLIWSDVYGPDGAVTETTDGFQGRINDIPIRFRLKSNTSDEGILAIAGNDYDTSRGAAFLISTQQKQTVVRQLDLNLTELDIFKAKARGIDNLKLKTLAKADADISAFFAERADNRNAP